MELVVPPRRKLLPEALATSGRPARSARTARAARTRRCPGKAAEAGSAIAATAAVRASITAVPVWTSSSSQASRPAGRRARRVPSAGGCAGARRVRRSGQRVRAGTSATTASSMNVGGGRVARDTRQVERAEHRSSAPACGDRACVGPASGSPAPCSRPGARTSISTSTLPRGQELAARVSRLGALADQRFARRGARRSQRIRKCIASSRFVLPSPLAPTTTIRPSGIGSMRVRVVPEVAQLDPAEAASAPDTRAPE